MYLNWTDKKLKKLKDKEYTVVLTIFGHCTTHSHGLKLKWTAWERCQFSIGTTLFHLYLYWKWREKKLWFFTLRWKVQYASVTLLTFGGRNTSPCKKKKKANQEGKRNMQKWLFAETHSLILLIILLTFLCPRLATQSHDSSLVI